MGPCGGLTTPKRVLGFADDESMSERGAREEKIRARKVSRRNRIPGKAMGLWEIAELFIAGPSFYG
jgi:hypothetical protein